MDFGSRFTIYSPTLDRMARVRRNLGQINGFVALIPKGVLRLAGVQKIADGLVMMLRGPAFF